MAAGGGAEPEKAGAAGRRAPDAKRRVGVVARHVRPEDSADEAGEQRPLSEVAASEDGAPDAGSTSSPLDLEGAKFAAIQSLRTGNPTRDMMTAMMIPLLFKTVTDSTDKMGKAFDKLMDYFKKPPGNVYTRHIEVQQNVNQWGYSFSNDDSRNTVLVRAITLYLAEKDLKYKDASVSLMRMKENRYCYSDSENDDDDDDEDKDSRSEAGQLKKHYRLARSAPEEMWVTVEPDVRFMKKTEEDEAGKEAKTTKKKIILSLQSSTEEKVDAFVDKAYTWYLNELRKMQDHSRYMYELVSIGGKKEEGDDGGDTSARKYRRYKLSDEKTFKSLFFPEKETLLKLLEDFTAKQGKYSIPGYPHKLGILCHGPPGTGKTSMIKAMANHLQRNIVNVPLARIQTNSELMDVMFDTRYQVVGQEVPIKLRFKDVIFVMEDVDAISKIVHKRDSKDGSAASGLVVPPAPAETGGPEPGAGQLETVKEEGPKASAADGESKEEPKEKAQEEPKKEKPEKEEEACAGVADDDDSKKPDSAVAALVNMLAPVQGPTKDGSGGTSALSGASSDKLNLSGILNALDGVVDSPNRILIMTSNHPEKLDPALIRPGRIDKKFLLGYMSGLCCSQMVAHYFQSALAQSDVERIGGLVDGGSGRPGLQITPARLEQLCAEHETVDSLCQELQKLLGFGPTGMPLPRLTLSRTPSVSVEDSIARAQTEPPAAVVKRW